MIEKRSEITRLSEIEPEASAAHSAERQIQNQREAIRRKSRLAVLAAFGSVIDLYTTNIEHR